LIELLRGNMNARYREGSTSELRYNLKGNYAEKQNKDSFFVTAHLNSMFTSAENKINKALKKCLKQQPTMNPNNNFTKIQELVMIRELVYNFESTFVYLMSHYQLDVDVEPTCAAYVTQFVKDMRFHRTQQPGFEKYEEQGPYLLLALMLDAGRLDLSKLIGQIYENYKQDLEDIYLKLFFPIADYLMTNSIYLDNLTFLSYDQIGLSCPQIDFMDRLELVMDENSLFKN